MSIIFGVRGSSEDEGRREDFYALAQGVRRYATDGQFVKLASDVAMGFMPYYTHGRSHLEAQPTLSEQGDLVVLDGRVDNHQDLCRELSLKDAETPDSAIVLAAFRRWGEQSFAHLVGDWAIALWCQECRSLYLARDHAGVRTLYFERKNDTVRWSTYLESFLIREGPLQADLEYAANYLSGMPCFDRTPFRGIVPVPAGGFVRFSREDEIRSLYWKPLPHKQIRYGKVSEYDEQFLSLFRTSVQRRVSEISRVVAHLSGGMDSTAIVCMADQLPTDGPDSTSLRLQTVSYYDDDEPNWNEKPYFSIVERSRRVTGVHIRSSYRDRTFTPVGPDYLYLLPGADDGTICQERVLNDCLAERDIRVVLSGIGGDELLGGLPSANPELSDLLASGRVIRFAARSIDWSLAQRKPLIHTWARVGRFIHGAYLSIGDSPPSQPPWLTCPTAKQSEPVSGLGFFQRITLRPSSLQFAKVWEQLLTTMPSLTPEYFVRREYRYPYLDRDLVEFLLAIPRNVLVAPARRRLMMRRALRGIVPEQILERKRKAYLDRGVVRSLQEAANLIKELFSASLLGEAGLLKTPEMLELFEPGNVTALTQQSYFVMRAISYELWLRANASRISLRADGRASQETGSPQGASGSKSANMRALTGWENQ